MLLKHSKKHLPYPSDEKKQLQLQISTKFAQIKKPRKTVACKCGEQIARLQLRKGQVVDTAITTAHIGKF